MTAEAYQADIHRPALPLSKSYAGEILATLKLAWPLVLTQLASMAYLGIAAGGLTVLTGINGQLSLGHGALMAIGAYTSALLTLTTWSMCAPFNSGGT